MVQLFVKERKAGNANKDKGQHKLFGVHSRLNSESGADFAGMVEFPLGWCVSRLDGVYSVTLEELKQNHGLLVEGSWEHLDFDEDTKQFMKHLIQNNHDLLKEADIKIMTLHGSKGKESDNVVLYTDFGADEYQSNFIEGEFEKSPDNEHRLFFVGVTRTKQKLYLLQSEEGTGYVI